MKRWFWQADLQLRLGQAMLESLWLYVSLRMLGNLGVPDVRLGLLALACLPVAGVLAAQAGERLAMRVSLRRLLLLPVAAALSAGWIHAIVGESPVHSVLGVYLAARGLLIGLQTAGANTARWFVLGAITIVVLCAVVARVALPVSPAELDTLRALALAYFASGIALLANVHRVSTHRLAHEPRTFSAAWLIAIAAPIAALSCAALALASATSLLKILLEFGYNLADQVGYWTLQLIGLLASILGALMRGLGQLFGVAADGGGPARGGNASTTTASQPSGCQPAAQHALGAPGDDPMPYLALVVLAIGAMWFLRQLLQARVPRERAVPAPSEESTSLWSWALFRSQLADFWAGLIASWRRTAIQLIERVAGAPPSEEHAAPRDMRDVYRSVLRWAARRGQRRAAGTTPLEFADQLERSLGHGEALRLITAHYVEERYGETQTLPEDLAHAGRTFDRLQRSQD